MKLSTSKGDTLCPACNRPMSIHPYGRCTGEMSHTLHRIYSVGESDAAVFRILYPRLYPVSAAAEVRIPLPPDSNSQYAEYTVGWFYDDHREFDILSEHQAVWDEWLRQLVSIPLLHYPGVPDHSTTFGSGVKFNREEMRPVQ